MLQGRRRECEALDGLLERIRRGESSSLVLRGESGVGKSALLSYLAGRASGFRVARATGVQSEMELAFAGVHHLCAPLLDGLEALPGPQREALSVAFGLRSGEPPDRFLVALAVLNLLAETAEARPLVCVVDDAQWLDQTSALVLAFVARRLLAERVAIVFAVREPVEADVLAGVPALRIDGLAADDARALLATAVPGRLDERVRDRIVAETRGNPLALLELPAGLTPAELAGGFALPDARPLANRIERSFLQRTQALPHDTQRLLLLAAAEPVGDLDLLWRAAERLGVGADAGRPAEAAGLIELGLTARFKHPLVRSAVYRGAAVSDRRAAHAALAEATNPGADPDRRAWHRAHASARPDEAIAAELLRSADRAAGRGGLAAKAAFLEWATKLTPDPGLRAERALEAAQAKLLVADHAACADLLAAARTGPLDELRRARLDRLRGRLTLVAQRGGDAAPRLLDAARRLAPLDGDAARETYLEAISAAVFAGRLAEGPGVEDVAREARTAPPGTQPRDALLAAVAVRFADGYASAIPALPDALRGLDDGRWLWLACRLAQDLWDDELWHALATRGVREARESGALSTLPIVATHRAALHVHAGAFDAAAVLLDEIEAVTLATGVAPVRYGALVLAAWQGDLDHTHALLERNVQNAVARGEGSGLGVFHWATALLHNAAGRYEDALAAAQRACEHEDMISYGWALVELVEAGVRVGQRDVAAAAFARLRERTQASGTEWALGAEASAHALLADAPEPLHQEAIERLGRSRGAVHLARAQLLYGEWLRREQRRTDARTVLRGAHERFTRIGARAFAERAWRELRATGESTPRLTDATRDALTPQEAQIARFARDGHTNPEIAERLFISPRTVEYHLHKVFRKLGVSTRRELRTALPDAPSPLGCS
ncbi:ATP-binding protein [Solirubrobacter deserti]|uniref:AAA family ATPase n=1 Tax=Solirubrobacter deserti TaxID=2282478 RepID=A0ABT4RT17_9ACTN|nr:helix-turn-helix transcriptional regulator [Solirubrobacter deserti]MDA0141731.1 AAA family ATPase [Solirubrobacter deserti]